MTSFYNFSDVYVRGQRCGDVWLVFTEQLQIVAMVAERHNQITYPGNRQSNRLSLQITLIYYYVQKHLHANARSRFFAQ